MVRKRKTIEDDYERLAERIHQRGRGKIRNKADFLSVYDSYMKDSGARNNIDLRNKSFNLYKTQHPKVTGSLVSNKERVKVFRQAGSKPSKEEFDIVGRVNGRTTYIRETRIKLANGRVKRIYRDTKGRFARPSRVYGGSD